MPEKKEPDAITAISVKGFKSLADETRLEIRPLTLLAGANSSGKSSAMQPILLLKQTLEASYDPGPLLLSDSHVKFTSPSQLLSKTAGRVPTSKFQVGIELQGGHGLTDIFSRRSAEQFELVRMEIYGGPISNLEAFHAIADQRPRLVLRPGMGDAELDHLFREFRRRSIHHWEVYRERCFLKPAFRLSGGGFFPRSALAEWLTGIFDQQLRRILHVPGLRGNPTRSYPMTAVGEHFPGTFENYVASVIAAWQKTRDDRLELLSSSMESLGLSWKIKAKTLDATQVELLVAMLPKRRRGGVSYLVNIADVGFGISQVLPVLVALLAAEPGDLVYLEQPELHLHPRAQQALAEVLAGAAVRGIQVVAETHSSTLLLAIQALVAEGKLDPNKAKLHWFQRGDERVTKVTSADLDPQGAYGDWPEDFGEVRAQAENRYLDAVEAKVFPPKKPKRNAKSR